MFADSKYSKFLTGLLIVVIVAIVGLLGFLGVDFYKKYFVEEDKKEFLDTYETQIGTKIKEVKEEELDTSSTSTPIANPLEDLLSNPSSSTGDEESSSNTQTEKKNPKYKGFDVLGRIEIPKTKVDYPILANAGKKAIEVAVGVQYGPGPNKVGNTVIAGHNYKNGTFFSNNKKLNIGDPIYITDNDGMKLKYIIYDKFETAAEDTNYMVRDTNGGREISLTTCLDVSSQGRLILLAKPEQ